MIKELLKKYNTPVPRYTSYPPANFFKDTYTAVDYLEAVEQSNSWEPKNISLYFHLPFCSKLCFYCGCNSYPMADQQTVLNYVEALKAELKLVSKFIDKNRPVSQVHFGGGTPNSVPVEYLTQIMDVLYETFIFKSTPEIAIECNPAYLDLKYLQQLKTAGFNRFSLGIQDFNLQVLKGVNRDPSPIPAKDLVLFLKDGSPGIRVNLDFIYGLPYQTPDSFTDTIQKAIDIEPDRLVTFSYAHVPWVNKNQEILEKSGLPDNNEKAKMYEKACDLLTEQGYKAIGLDHFVQENDELFQALKSGTLHRNFQGYCTRGTTGQVYAFGVSGISQLHKAYAQNSKSVLEYIAAIKQEQLPIRKGYALNDQEITVREVITELMCNKQINWNSLAESLFITAPKIKEVIHYNESVLKQFQDDGIIQFSDENIKVTDEGVLFIRNVAASFDPLLVAGNQMFSKPV